MGGNNYERKNIIYCIAYNDKEYNGFFKTEPWILDEFGNNLKKCRTMANELIRSYYKDVTIFGCDELPEEITWKFVKEHEYFK